MSSRYSTLQLTLDPRGVLFVSLNRPSVRNAFDGQLIEDLHQVFSQEVLDSQTRIIVLRGNGPLFCAGGDLNWMRRSVDLSYEENLKDTRRLSELFAKLNECPKPLIGVIHGAAIGGGVGLVSVCDIALATEDCVFSLSEVRLGIVPACIGPFVIAKIGASQARRFFMSAERFYAPQAKEIGLIHEVASDLTVLESALDRLLNNMLQCGPHAMAAAKTLVLNLSWPERRAQTGDYLESVSQMLADLRIAPEGQEGLLAFLEKRKPSWLIESGPKKDG